MLHKTFYILASITLFNLFFLPNSIYGQSLPVISTITDNRGAYPNSQIPKYEKFEITFNVNSSGAKNYYLPFDANPPSGLTPSVGITVNVELTFDNWTTTLIQPAFYYQPYDDQLKGNREWFYPTGNPLWKARFSPDRQGAWKYRIRVVDASGTVVAPEQNFTVSNSTNKGFVKISSQDPRYFEFDDGTFFTGLGYNMNFRQVDWINPSTHENLNNFSKMKENGINFIRIWLSQWSIYGPLWSPWKDFNSQGGDPPATTLTSLTDSLVNPNYATAMNSGTVRNCIFYDVYNQAAIALKRNTNYQVRAYVYPEGLQGSGGFSVKLGNYTGCAAATSITPVLRQGATQSWQWLEGTFNSGASDFVDHLYLHYDNMTEGSVKVAEVQMLELVGGTPTGPNIIPKYKADSYDYFNQRNSYAFDKLLDLARQNEVYLRPVIFDHRDWIFNRINFSGNPTQNAPCDPGVTGPQCPSASYFYGLTDRSDSKVRWLQKSVLRYLHARYGYSTNIHSWEWVNEGTTGTEHAIAADIAGQYFDSFNTNRHLVSTSTWNQQRTTASWWGGLTNYPGIDFADIHRYINSTDAPSQYYDVAEMTVNGSATHGSTNPSVLSRFPVVRGEGGLMYTDSTGNQIPTAEIVNSYPVHKGVWLHNYLWATLNSGAMYEPAWWWPQQHIYPNSYDIRPLFKHLYDFENNIPLNKGGYVDISATGFDANLIRVVGQKNTSSNKAHLWIQNKKHTWCAIAGNIQGCPVSWDNSRLNGTITISGFSANQTLPVEYWYFDNSVTLTKQIANISTGDGTININLSGMPATVVDVGIKIGNYLTATNTNTPTPSMGTVLGDANGDSKVDGADYIIWLNHYGQNIGGINNADFNYDGKVDGADYVIWLNNYNV